MHSLPIEPTVVAALRARLAAGTLSSADAREIMRESYRNYVRQNTHCFRALFAHLLQDHAPLVIHCTAGKDRTGFACALVLHTLGVPDEIIVEDYLLTNRFYRRDPASAAGSSRRGQGSDRIGRGVLSCRGIRRHPSRLWWSRPYVKDGLGIGENERTALQDRYLQG